MGGGRQRHADRRRSATCVGTSTDIDAAYAIQQINTDRKIAAGMRVSGRKIGVTSKAVQQQIGVDKPDFGTLFAQTEYGDGTELPTDRLIQPRAEGEVALVLEHDLDNAPHGFAEVVRAVAFALPAIEVVDSRIENWQISLVDTVADNASCGFYVVGSRPVPLRDVRHPYGADVDVDQRHRGLGRDGCGLPRQPAERRPLVGRRALRTRHPTARRSGRHDGSARSFASGRRRRRSSSPASVSSARSPRSCRVDHLTGGRRDTNVPGWDRRARLLRGCLVLRDGGRQHAVDVRGRHAEGDADLDQRDCSCARQRAVGERDRDHPVQEALLAVRRQLLDQAAAALPVRAASSISREVGGECHLVVLVAADEHQVEDLVEHLRRDPVAVGDAGLDHARRRVAHRRRETFGQCTGGQYLEHARVRNDGHTCRSRRRCRASRGGRTERRDVVPALLLDDRASCGRRHIAGTRTRPR